MAIARWWRRLGTGWLWTRLLRWLRLRLRHRRLLALALIDVLRKSFPIVYFVLSDCPDGFRIVTFSFAAHDAGV